MPRTIPERKPREQRRAELLGAAREGFIASGYHAASMDDIADHAGVSKPVLYQYFAGKLYLYLALLDAAMMRLTAGIDDALASGPDDRARVEALIRAFFTFASDPRGDYHLVFDSDMVNDPAVHERVRRFDEALTTRVSDMLIQDAELERGRSRLTAAALLGLAQRAAWHWASASGPDAPGAHVDGDLAAELVTQLAWLGVRGLVPPAESSPGM